MFHYENQFTVMAFHLERDLVRIAWILLWLTVVTALVSIAQFVLLCLDARTPKRRHLSANVRGRIQHPSNSRFLPPAPCGTALTSEQAGVQKRWSP